MTGRIRTIKPEWLEDEFLAAASDSARMLSAALMLMADDYGRGRGSVATVAAEAWRFELERDDGAHARETLAKVSRVLQELRGIRFMLLYEVEGQRYFAIRTWKRHQKVDHPSKPRIPEPDPAEWAAFCKPRDTLLEASREPRESLGEVAETLAPHTSDLRPVPVPTTSRASAFGDIAEGGNNPEPVQWPEGWHPQRLALVLDECIREATGGAFAFSRRTYTPLSDALDLFVQANPEDPAEPCRFAFRAFAKDNYARKAKCSVALFLTEPGKYLGAEVAT